MWKVFNVLANTFRRMMEITNKNNTVVVVLGATGTGKSKLAIEIASKYNGEIINADSMQIYKGLNIATNKVSDEERKTVPHHMLDFLDPLKFYNVVDFRNATLPLITRIHGDGKVPVIVGGTHYYVESLLWNVLVSNESVSELSELNYSKNKAKDVLNRINFIKENISEINNKKKLSDVHAKSESLGDKQESGSDTVLKHSDREVECSSSDNLCHFVNNGSDKNSDISDKNSDISDKNSDINDKLDLSDSVKYSKSELKNLFDLIKSEVSNEQLLQLLGLVDCEKAKTFHPNDRRKILRSLEVWIHTGVRHSEYISRQSVEVGGADLGGRIRYENVAILWVTCDQNVLDERLDARVDQMIEQGLVQELSDFHSTYYRFLLEKQNEAVGENNTTITEWYRKGIFQCIGFKEFEEYLQLDEEQRATNDGDIVYKTGIDLMKLRTRQYSRHQLKWIRNRFFLRERKKIPIYAVDATDPSLWKENVSPIAEDVVSNILCGKAPSTNPVIIQPKEKIHNSGDKTRHFCEVCERVFIGDHQWQAHVQGFKHRKILKRKSAKEETKVEEKYPKVSL